MRPEIAILAASIVAGCALLNPENWKRNSKVKIVAHAMHSNKDKAMYNAYQKALITINDFGCDQDTGKGDVTYKRIGSQFIAEATYRISKKYCKRYVECKGDWIKQQSRTQGGGWIWYPGHGTAKTLDKADFIAKGRSLKQLNEEYSFIPKKTQFNERCVKVDGGLFTVLLRSATKDSWCRQRNNEKTRSQPLTKLLANYEKLINK